MEAATDHDQQALAEQLAQARAKAAALASDLAAIDAELEGLATERKQHRLVLEACSTLERLSEIGGEELFWGEGTAAGASADYIRRIRHRVDAFNGRVADIETRRRGVIEELSGHENYAGLVEDALFEAQEEEERRRQEWIIEREISELPARKMVMPWTRGGEDDKRFRKSLATALLVCLLFAVIAPQIELPLPSPEEAPEVPERVVRLMIESRPKPLPPPAAPREEVKPPPQQQLAEQKPVPQRPAPRDEQPPQQQSIEEPRKAEKGILAFREKLAAMKDEQVVARLGSQAQINEASNSTGRPERAMLTSNAPGSSGGINLAALSRGVGGGGTNGLARVQVARATSAIGGGSPGGDRPLSGDGPGLSRTDEEIQIVFDRYKAALYRLYNRELRKDPTLRGQVVLRLTIEADGSVSLCELQSSDMNAPELTAQVVERVRTINFGAKEGVSAITIVYPIDFLPAA